MKLLKQEKPLVSVILPTYNRAKYLKLALESVLRQDFKDFELLVINDGSTDNTEEVVNSFSDERIVYVRQENQGEYPATNNGLRLARGKYLTWIHSDDLWPKDSLKIRVEGLDKNKNVDFVHGDIENIDEKGDIIKFLPAVNFDAKEAFLEYYKPLEKRVQEFLVHHTTVMFRREFLLKSGYWDETLPFAGDYDWMFRALLNGRMKKMKGVLYYYRLHPESRCATDPKKGIDTHAVNVFIRNRYKKYAKT
jgi:glycosyltransferase involved in cell wall biosynthesis